ncbi:glycosyltransferase family 2 protein [Patescibacteria group bacterium]
MKAKHLKAINGVNVSVIILNWNRKKEVLDLLQKLKKQTFKGFETLVVDNCSTDGSVAIIAKRFPQVKVVRLKKNHGKSGFNFGMEEAQGDLLVLFDSDVLPKKDVVAKYVKKMKQDKQLGLACAAVYLQDGRFYGPAYDQRKKSRDDGFKVLYYAGGSVALRKKTFEKTGGFEERYFMCLVELEWATRIRLAGFKVRVFPEIKVIEKKAKKGSDYRSHRGFYYTRNGICYYVKYLPLRCVSRFLKRHFASVGYRVKKTKTIKLRHVLLGIPAGLWRAWGFFKERSVLPIKLVKEVERETYGGSRVGWKEGNSP